MTRAIRNLRNNDPHNFGIDKMTLVVAQKERFPVSQISQVAMLVYRVDKNYGGKKIVVKNTVKKKLVKF